MNHESPQNKVKFAFPMNLKNSSLSESSPDARTSMSEIISSKADQHAKLVAAKKMKNYYKERIVKLNEQIEDLNMKGESTLSSLDQHKDTLISQKEYLTDLLTEIPDINFLEEQYYLLSHIEKDQNFGIDDETIFHELGILNSDEDLTSLPQRLAELLELLENSKKQVRSSQNSILKRRYQILQSTINTSLKRAENERDRLKDEIDKLYQKLHREEEKNKKI